jgi:hypothetical protein
LQLSQGPVQCFGLDEWGCTPRRAMGWKLHGMSSSSLRQGPLQTETSDPCLIFRMTAQ